MFPADDVTIVSAKTLSSSPEWFTTPFKTPYRPSPLRASVSLPSVNEPESVDPLSPISPVDSLFDGTTTPPLSPSGSLASFSMSRKLSSASTCGSDGDDDQIITPPVIPRRNSHMRSSLAPPSYFDFQPQSSKKGKKAFRPRFPSAPVEGSITPMWKLEDETANNGLVGLLDPFEMLLPYARRHSEPVYELDQDSFVLAHVPAKTVSLSAFKPGLIRVPRWQRPIVIAVMSVMLFGSLCMVSWLQQSMVQSGHSAAIRQGEWMVKQAAIAREETEAFVDVEPGYKPVATKHHSLKVQAKIASRASSGANQQLPLAAAIDFHMTKDDELAALTNFIVSTTANYLPEIDVNDAASLEALLPFNPRSARAQEELAELVQSQWENHPVMVFGNLRDPKMRDTRALLSKYNIKPAPFYVDIDLRADAKVLSSSLERILGAQQSPYILLKGKNIGESTKLAELEKKETLVETVAASGASIAKKLKRNKHQREEERKENERVLGPRPIFD